MLPFMLINYLKLSEKILIYIMLISFIFIKFTHTKFKHLFLLKVILKLSKISLRKIKKN